MRKSEIPNPSIHYQTFQYIKRFFYNIVFTLICVFTIVLLINTNIISQPLESPQEQLIRAQIENQVAQTNYYKAHTAGSAPTQNWWQLIFSLIGTVIGACAALTGVYLTNKARRKDEITRENRLAVAEVGKNLVSGIQAISLITWTAKNKNLTKEHIIEYIEEMKKIFPNIIGSRAVLEAINKIAHDQISPLSQRLYDLHSSIREATLMFKESPNIARDTLTNYYDVSLNYEKEIIDKVIQLLH